MIWKRASHHTHPRVQNHQNIQEHTTKHRGATVGENGFGERAQWLRGDCSRLPGLHRASAGGIARRYARQWGVCWGRKADSWGRRLGWMGAVLWHTKPGTEASTDGCWAARLQGDSQSTFRMVVSQKAARQRRRTSNTRYSSNTVHGLLS